MIFLNVNNNFKQNNSISVALKSPSTATVTTVAGKAVRLTSDCFSNVIIPSKNSIPVITGNWSTNDCSATVMADNDGWLIYSTASQKVNITFYDLG